MSLWLEIVIRSDPCEAYGKKDRDSLRHSRLIAFQACSCFMQLPTHTFPDNEASNASNYIIARAPIAVSC